MSDAVSMILFYGCRTIQQIAQTMCISDGASFVCTSFGKNVTGSVQVMSYDVISGAASYRFLSDTIILVAWCGIVDRNGYIMCDLGWDVTTS